MKQFYWYYFEDGYKVCVSGFSKNELKIEIAKHGKIIRIARD